MRDKPEHAYLKIRLGSLCEDRGFGDRYGTIIGKDGKPIAMGDRVYPDEALIYPHELLQMFLDWQEKKRGH